MVAARAPIVNRRWSDLRLKWGSMAAKYWVDTLIRLSLPTTDPFGTLQLV